MEKIIIIKGINIKFIQNILMEVGNCTKISYLSEIYNNVTYKVTNNITTIINKQSSDELILDIFQLFTLIRVIDYIILNLGINDFKTVTGYDINEGLQLLEDLKKYLD